MQVKVSKTIHTSGYTRSNEHNLIEMVKCVGNKKERRTIMRVLIIEPQKEPYVKEISSGIEAFMEVVGKEPVAICPYEDSRVTLVFNKPSKRKNQRLTNLSGVGTLKE